MDPDIGSIDVYSAKDLDISGEENDYYFRWEEYYLFTNVPEDERDTILNRIRVTQNGDAIPRTDYIAEVDTDGTLRVTVPSPGYVLVGESVTTIVSVSPASGGDPVQKSNTIALPNLGTVELNVTPLGNNRFRFDITANVSPENADNMLVEAELLPTESSTPVTLILEKQSPTLYTASYETNVPSSGYEETADVIVTGAWEMMDGYSQSQFAFVGYEP